jgi:hypothetical protein
VDSNWKIIAAEGQGNTYDGKPVQTGTQVPAGKILQAGQTGKLKALHRFGVLVVLPPRSKVILHAPAAPSNSFIGEVLDGYTRWIFRKSSAACAKTACRVNTATAVMGVRGTDFVVGFNPLFKETEIIGFDGTVEFGNRQNEGDTRLVPAGHWGGLGGRFGPTIGPLLRLPANILTQFKTNVTFPSTLPCMKASADFYQEAVPDGY